MLSCYGLFVGMLLLPKNVCVARDLLEIHYLGSIMGVRNRLIICSSNVVSVEEFGVICWLLVLFLTLVCTGMMFSSGAAI
jgi:hypothetical protein